MMSSVGLHRVLAPVGVLPQAAWRLDASPRIGADEVLIGVERSRWGWCVPSRLFEARLAAD